MKSRYFAKGLALSVFGAIAIAPETTLAQHEHNLEDTRFQLSHELPDLNITADPRGRKLSTIVEAVSVIPKGELVINAEPTIGETVGNEPGVHSSYFGPGASRPIVRGNAGERVRVLRNGVGTLDVSNTSEDHNVASNPLTSESIEILRGPETLLYGSSAIGGVVNVNDNSIPERPVGKPLTGALDIRTATGDDELSGAAKIEGQVDSFNWHVDYFHQDSDDIDIPGLAESEQLRAQEEAEGEAHEEDIANGTLPDSDSRSAGFSVGASHVWENGFVGVSVSHYDSRYGVPGHAHAHEDEHGHGDEDEHDEDGHHDEDEHHDDEHDDDHARIALELHDDEEQHAHEEDEEAGVKIDLKQTRVDLRGRFEKISDNVSAINVKIGASNYEHDELEGDEVASTYENDAVEGRVEVLHQLSDSLDGVLGAQVQFSEFSAIGEEAFVPSTDTFSPAVFIFEELKLNDHWKLQGGGRYEHVNYDADGLSGDSFNPFGLSAGVVFDPTGRNDYTLGLTFAYTQRAPASTELYADGAHIARSIFESGDRSLDVEESYGADLTFKKNTGLVTGMLNLFVQDYENYINLRGTGAEEDELPVFVYEETRAFFWGFEAETVFHLHEVLDLWAHDIDLGVQVDFVRARDTSNSANLPRIPPLRTIVGLDYAYKEVASARIEGVFVDSQDKVADFELPTDSYQLLNASASFNLPVEEDMNLAFYVKGTNLTDEEARVHSSFIKDLAPLRGRSVLFGLRGTF